MRSKTAVKQPIHEEEKTVIPSLILNLVNVLLVAGCVLHGLRKVRPGKLFRYFTTLSNVLCAIASLIVFLCAAFGKLPFRALLLKYVGTTAVTVTLLTVFLFLGPTSHDWKGLLVGDELFLHLVCPVLAIVSFLVFEKTAMPAWTIAIGALPVPLYGALYLYKVVSAPEPRRWEDFYGFNRGGKWPVSFGLMTLGGALLAFLLWLL